MVADPDADDPTVRVGGAGWPVTRQMAGGYGALWTSVLTRARSRKARTVTGFPSMLSARGDGIGAPQATRRRCSWRATASICP